MQEDSSHVVCALFKVLGKTRNGLEYEIRKMTAWLTKWLRQGVGFKIMQLYLYVFLSASCQGIELLHAWDLS